MWKLSRPMTLSSICGDGSDNKLYFGCGRSSRYSFKPNISWVIISIWCSFYAFAVFHSFEKLFSRLFPAYIHWQHHNFDTFIGPLCYRTNSTLYHIIRTVIWKKLHQEKCWDDSKCTQIIFFWMTCAIWKSLGTKSCTYQTV